jgi:hypothetical protein
MTFAPITSLPARTPAARSTATPAGGGQPAAPSAWGADSLALQSARSAWAPPQPTSSATVNMANLLRSLGRALKGLWQRFLAWLGPVPQPSAPAYQPAAPMPVMSPPALAPVPAPLTPTAPAPSAGAIAVQVDRTRPIGLSQLATGATLTQNTLDGWGDAQSVSQGLGLLGASSTYSNQHLMGFGADNPEPSPGVYDFSTLDARVDTMRQSGTTPVITLCGAPDWMKGGQPGQTDWSRIEAAPTREHFDDFANLCKQIALRYPDVTHFQVWNEMKGFWNDAENRWDYEGYTELYNKVYDALKSVNPAIQVGGPYVVMDSSPAHAGSHPSALAGAYGTIDQRGLDVYDYWLKNAHGADFICVDGGSQDADPSDPFAATQKFQDVTAWLKQRTDLPVWWSEWYVTDVEHETESAAKQNALGASALMAMVRGGASVELRWGPEGRADGVSEESLWTSTGQAGGAQPYPMYGTMKAIHDAFPPGTPLYAAATSTNDVDVLASDTHTLLVNKRDVPVTVTLDGQAVTLAPYEVRLSARSAPQA